MNKEYYIVRITSEEYVKYYYASCGEVYLKTTKDIYRAWGIKNQEAAKKLYENACDYFKKCPRISQNLHIKLLKVNVNIEEVC